MKQNIPSPRHIIIKVIKFRGNSKGRRVEQRVLSKETTARIIADLSAQTLQARREWRDIFEVLKGKKMQPRVLYWDRINRRVKMGIRHKMVASFSEMDICLPWVFEGSS